MGYRSWGWPAWARVLTWTGFMALSLVVVQLFVSIGEPSRPNILAITAISAIGALIFGCMMEVANRPARDAYTQAMAGLTDQDRADAARGAWRGPVSGDPAVLAASARLHAAVADPKGRGDWPRWLQVTLFSVYGIMMILAILNKDWKNAALYVGMLVLFAYLARHNIQRMSHGKALRAAADELLPGGYSSATADTVNVRSRLIRRGLAVAAALLVVLVGIGGYAVWWSHAHPKPCDVAIDALSYATHNKDARNAGQPVAVYQEFADRMADYDRQITAPALTDHFQRIAELARQTVTLGPTVSSSDQQSEAVRYEAIWTDLYLEYKAVLNACD